MFGLVALLALLAPLVSANLATIYFPVFTPNPSTPWVVGQKNILSWETGGETGIDVFDIQLHNVNETIMHGFLPIALRVPMTRGAKRGNYGGSMEVDLAATVPTGPGFILMFMQTLHGQVYARSQRFEILAATPDNYTTVTDYPTATRTATLDHFPNPTQEWAITLDGSDPDETATAKSTASIVGNVGS